MENKKITSQNLKKINNFYLFLTKNRYSSFYKEKYQKAGVSINNINSFEDFQKIPFLTKNEILKAGPDKFFFLPLNKAKYVGISSGTTNSKDPLILLHTRNSKSIFKLRDNKHLELKIKRIMLLYSMLPMQNRINQQLNLTEKGILNIVGDINNLQVSAKLASKLKIDALQVTPSILYFFIPYLKKEYDLNNIKLLVMGGEYTSVQKHKYFKKLFKNAYIKYTFASIETSRLGDRCDYLSELAPRFFHPLTQNFYYEVIDENELVVTSLRAFEYPFVFRYKTGNNVKITDYKCKCGNNKLMEVFGKLETDVIRLQGAFVYASEIHNALSPYSKHLLSFDFRLHVYEVIKKDKIMPKLVLQLVPKRRIKDPKKLKDEIEKDISENLFVTSNATLSKLVEREIFMPLEVEFIEMFPFSQKQKLIISHLV